MFKIDFRVLGKRILIDTAIDIGKMVQSASNVLQVDSARLMAGL